MRVRNNRVARWSLFSLRVTKNEGIRRLGNGDSFHRGGEQLERRCLRFSAWMRDVDARKHPDANRNRRIDSIAWFATERSNSFGRALGDVSAHPRRATPP